MMGGKRDGPIPISTYPNAINTFSNIEKVIVVDLFSPTSVYCTITPTIYFLGGTVDVLGPTSNSPITTNSIYLNSTIYHIRLS